MKQSRSLKTKGGSCPNCAAPIAFHFSGTLVAVCEFCESLVGRADRDLNLIGKVADANGIKYGGKQFHIYDRGRAYVRSCLGEFYWRVRQGDSVSTADFMWSSAWPFASGMRWQRFAGIELHD